MEAPVKPLVEGRAPEEAVDYLALQELNAGEATSPAGLRPGARKL